MSSVIRRNLEEVRERVERACWRSGRKVDEVTLVAVTKTRSVQEIVQAVDCHLLVLGENRVEEAEAKIPAVSHARPDSQPRWDMIGHVQSRKAADVARLFSLVHSVDSIRLARRLDGFAREHGQPLPILLQVNVSGEASKHGFAAADVFEKAGFLSQLGELESLQHVDVQGLMTMAPLGADERELHELFARVRLLSEECRRVAPFCSWEQLSMGMTNDYEIAIEEGATLIRLGRAIFGDREA